MRMAATGAALRRRVSMARGRDSSSPSPVRVHVHMGVRFRSMAVVLLYVVGVLHYGSLLATTEAVPLVAKTSAIATSRATTTTTTTTKRPHCRVFVDASAGENRFVVVASGVGLVNARGDSIDDEEEERMVVIDRFDVVTPGLRVLPPADAYSKLRDGFLAVATDMRRADASPKGLEPRHCHTHLLVRELDRPAVIRGDDDNGGGGGLRQQLEATTFPHIHQDSIADAQFPFLFARDDLRVLALPQWAYFQLLGMNYLDGRLAASLGPGAVELSGLLALHDDALVVAFDVQERWRRGIRRRSSARALNTSDFHVRAHQDLAPGRVYASLTTLLASTKTVALDKDHVEEEVGEEGANGMVEDPDDGSTRRRHPCLFHGYKEDTDAVLDGTSEASRVELLGSGDATQCIAQIRVLLQRSNKDCPDGMFCIVNSVTEPKPMNPFFATGRFVTIVQTANAILQVVRDAIKEEEAVTAMPVGIELPTPTLSGLRDAADQVCMTQWSSLQEWSMRRGTGSDEGVALPMDALSMANACFDLCHMIVLLEQIGIKDEEKRIVIGEPDVNAAHDEALASVSFSTRAPSMTEAPTPHETSWLVGAFLYMELLDLRKSFNLEADIFAVRVSEGLPIGWNLSLVLLVAVCVFVYVTTGARPRKIKSGYRRLGNNTGRHRAADVARTTTCAIVFIDDASE